MEVSENKCSGRFTLDMSRKKQSTLVGATRIRVDNGKIEGGSYETILITLVQLSATTTYLSLCRAMRGAS